MAIEWLGKDLSKPVVLKLVGMLEAGYWDSELLIGRILKVIRMIFFTKADTLEGIFFCF